MTNNIRAYKGIYPTLGKNTYIDPSAVVIGNTALGDDASVWPGAIIRGDMHSIHVGARTSVQDGAILHITHASKFNVNGWPLHIGNDVTIGHQVCLHGAVIGDRVLVGIGAIVLDGARVESDVVIGAGSLVAPGKTLESGYLYLGSPCKKIRQLTEQEMAFFMYSSANYVALKNDYIGAS